MGEQITVRSHSGHRNLARSLPEAKRHGQNRYQDPHVPIIPISILDLPLELSRSNYHSIADRVKSLILQRKRVKNTQVLKFERINKCRSTS